MPSPTALQRMSGVAEKFSSANDLMQNSAALEQDENVQIKEKATPGGKKPAMKQDAPKEQRMQSRSKPVANAVRQYNTNNQNIINKHFPAANDGQTQRMDKQIHLQQQQAMSMKQLHSTMEEILHLLQRDANKITPKFQDFSNKGMTPEVLGKAQNGMIDKIGSLMGDLMSSFRDSIGSLGDLIGGEKKKKGRNKKRDRDRAKRRNESRARRGLPPMGEGGGGGGGGWWSRAGEKLSGAFKSGASSVREGLSHGRGGGRVGTALKVGAAVAGAVGVSKAVDWVGSKLGVVAKSEESGKGGVATVSSGKGDHGGASYGAHQLSSSKGTMTAYLQSPEGQKYAAEFQGMRPGSAEFNQKYKEVAARDPQGFGDSQEGFITRTHYAPQERKVSKATGTDMTKRGRAVQEMLYSTGVQYGPNSGVIAAALKGKAVANMSDSELIATVQDYKAETVDRYFASSSQKWRDGIRDRAGREKGKLLGIDQQEKEGKLAGDDPRKAAEMAKTENKSASEVATAQKAPLGAVPMSLADNAAQFGAQEEEESTVAQAQPVPPPQGFPVSPEAAGAALLATGGVVAADKMVKPKAPISLLAPTPAATPTVAPAATPKLPAAANEPHIGSGAKGVVTGTEEALVKAGGRSAARTLGKAVVPGANVAFGALDAYDVISDEEATKQEKERALAGVGGGMAGALAGGAAGTAAGAATGAAIGSLFFGVGAVPGAAIGTGLGFVGGAVGGYLGYDYGAEAGEAGYDALTGQPEDQAPRPVAGSTPLLMLTQQKADETGDQNAVDAAKAMKTVDDAIKKSTAAITVKLDANKEAGNKAAAQATEATAQAAETTSKAFAASTTPATVDATPSSGAVASSTPQTPGDMTTMLAAATTTGVAAGAGTVAGATSSLSAATADVGGALSGVAAGLAGMGLPPGWAESILANYSTAVATQEAAVAGAPVPVASQSTLPSPVAPAASNVYSMPAAQPAPPTVSADHALPPDTAPVILPGANGSTNPFANLAAPAKSAPPSVTVAPPTSPASPEYYKDKDVSTSASSFAPTSTPSAVNKSNAAPTSVSSASAAPPQIERQQYEPVKSVMMIEPKQQDTMMPQRMQPPGDKIPSKGISEGNSVRQTIDDCPAVISDQGLVMLQTGFI